MCLWEVLLNDRTTNPALDRHGWSAVRMAVLALAEPCHLAWEQAIRDGYDDSFDWDFCPTWLTDNVVWENSELPRIKS